MSQAIRFRAQLELAGKVEVDLRSVRYPHYGRYLEEFVPGQVFVHPRGFTFLRCPDGGFRPNLHAMQSALPE
jgi:2-methylfumaryl-CoA hydratase